MKLVVLKPVPLPCRRGYADETYIIVVPRHPSARLAGSFGTMRADAAGAAVQEPQQQPVSRPPRQLAANAIVPEGEGAEGAPAKMAGQERPGVYAPPTPSVAAV